MKQRMFDFVREEIKEVPGLEKWSLKQRVHPDIPESQEISPIKIAVAWKVIDEFQLGDTALGVAQEHRLGQPPVGMGFSMQMGSIYGGSLIYGVNNYYLGLLVGEIGDENGRMYQLPSSTAPPHALIEWLEELSNTLYW